MGFIVMLLIVVLFISGLVWVINIHEKEDLFAGVAFMVSSLISILVVTVVFVFSYFGYIGLLQRQALIEQHVTNLMSLEKMGVKAFIKGQQVSSEITDFKFGDYQDNVSKKLDNLSYAIRAYNDRLVGKKFLKNSNFWGILIYFPTEGQESMKVLKMSDLVESKK